MKLSRILHYAAPILVLALIVFLTTFAKGVPQQIVEPETQEEAQPEKIEIIYDAENPPMVPILEYHNLGEVDSRWTRGFDEFEEDLLWLYNNDYRPVTVDEFMAMDFERLEPGMKPVVITFDDSSMGQFRILTDNVTVDPRSAVGILDKFVEEHPDFGPQATFFVLPGGFGQPEMFEQKINYLRASGREVASHTYGHENLDEISADEIRQTLSDANDYLGFEMTSLAYPNGLYPDGEEEIQAVKDMVDAAFLVGAEPSLMPNHEEFDAYMIPRIQAIDEEWERHFRRESGGEPTFEPFVAGADYIVEKHYPYMDCKEFEYTPTSIGKVFWKAVKYRAGMISINNVPEDLKYRDGKYFYTIKGDEGSIAEKFFEYSSHYRITKFQQAIIDANPEKDFIEGDEILIPDIPAFLVKRHNRAEQPWGIYFTSYTATSDEGPRLVEQMKERGGKMIVFDVKEIDGHVYYPSKVQMAHDTGAQDHILIPNLENYIRYWHDQGVYMTARIVIFKDINLATARPDLAIQSSSGEPWANREGVVWLDPSNKETQDYILGLVEELAQAGVDEIQFDYIRFPTLGPVNETRYNFDEANVEKYEVIRNFIARVHDTLRPYESKLSLDVYGVIVWNNEYDSQSTGQKMACLGPYIDVVYPMVYPSHFGPGFAGHAQPGDAPYFFVAESIKLFNQYLEGTGTEIRPWIQAFAWRVTNYGQWYVDEQVKATNDQGWFGYALWNAGNNYF